MLTHSKSYYKYVKSKKIENFLDQNVHSTYSKFYLTTFNRDRRKVRLQKPMQLEK